MAWFLTAQLMMSNDYIEVGVFVRLGDSGGCGCGILGTGAGLNSQPLATPNGRGRCSFAERIATLSMWHC